VSAHQCATPNCERSTAWTTPPSRARYCPDCTAYLWRHGSLPVIEPRPLWLRRLLPKDQTGSLYPERVR
jgi:hypothetical protein